MLEESNENLVQLHLDTPKKDLTRWRGGILFARDPETGKVG